MRVRGEHAAGDQRDDEVRFLQGLRALRSGDPTLCGPFLLVGRLGVGGMGIVYAGADPSGKLVAVKRARSDGPQADLARLRITTEVRALATMGKTFTPTLIDAEVSGPNPWLATELLVGPTLRRVVAAHGPLPASDAWLVAVATAVALAEVHRAGIVHGDVKPGNVILTPRGPFLIDFGVAAADGSGNGDGRTPLLGTFGWMAPEQLAADAAASPAADMYCWAEVADYATTGTSPEREVGTASALAVKSPPAHGLIPEDSQDLLALSALCDAALNTDPRVRPTAEQAVAVLGRHVLDSPVMSAGFDLVSLAATVSDRWRSSPIGHRISSWSWVSDDDSPTHADAPSPAGQPSAATAGVAEATRAMTLPRPAFAADDSAAPQKGLARLLHAVVTGRRGRRGRRDGGGDQ